MMKEHPYFSWLQYQSRKIVADHPDSPDLADRNGNVVIVPREDELHGEHELVLLDDSYWLEESDDKVVAHNNRGHKVAVAHRD